MTVWEKLKNKLKEDGQGPSSADWEAMQAKIAAQPQLAPASKRPAWLGWVVGLSLGLLIGTGIWFMVAEKPSPISQEGQIEMSTPLESNAPVNATEASGKSEESSSDRPTAEPSTLSQTKVTETQAEAKTGEPELAGSEEAFKEAGIEQESIAELSNESWDEVDQAKAHNSSQSAADPSVGTDSSTTTAAASTEAAQEEIAAERSVTSNVDGEPMEAGEPRDGPSESKAGNSAEEPVLGQDATSSESESRLAEPESEAQAPSKEDAEEEQSLRAAEEFIDPASGFKLRQISFTANYLDNFNALAARSLGIGIDWEWQRDRQFFRMGLSYGQMTLLENQYSRRELTIVDSTYQQSIESREVIEIRRLWVIDSMFAGRYVNDTIRRTVIDTVNILRVDTNQSTTNIVRQTRRRFYYAELPLLYGYRWKTQGLSFGLAGGLALQQAVSYAVDEGEIRSEFGLSALLSPEIAWRIRPQWSMVLRSQLRYPLREETVFYGQRQLRYSFQLGVSYHW